MNPFLVLQHVPHEHPGTLKEALESRGIPYRTLALHGGDKVPDSLSGVGGLIVLGGPMSVHDEDRYPWLKDEDRLLREAVARDLPTLGICLGAQLIAKAGGARVRPGEEKEIGWYPLELTQAAEKDPVFSALPRELTVFQWHGDTFDIPSGGVRLAGSTRFTHQAFRLSRRVYGLQFHLEVTAEMIDSWILENREELKTLEGSLDPERMRLEIPAFLPALHHHALAFYNRFFSSDVLS
ncbi:MAG: type 1 glutamine amidotransferase [Nitrospirae bacterium]|nr:type 1 glutamine amidotransferase [Nitrospirota bacterium]